MDKLKRGIAGIEDILDRMEKKTGMGRKEIMKNINHINKRLKSKMDDENIHTIFMKGMGRICENYKMLKKKCYKVTSSEKLNKKYNTKRENLHKIINVDLKGKKTIHYIKQPSFMYRRLFGMSDEEMEEIQNSQK